MSARSKAKPSAGLDLNSIVERAMALGADFCDARIDEWQGFSLEIMQSRTRNVVTSLGSGVCIRALVDGAWGFAATSDVSRSGLLNCCEKAVKLGKACKNFVKVENKFTIPERIKFSTGTHEITAADAMDCTTGEDKINACLEL
nr:DNA gyrase modulator [Candidatus Sigynarchaeota archaeon]